MNTIDKTTVDIKTKCSRDAITQMLQGKIVSGEWPVGSRIPSLPELAELFNSSTFTVHKAITPLVQMGLLERTRRLGTFVCTKNLHSTRSADNVSYSGILLREQTGSRGGNQYPNYLRSCLQRLLQAAGQRSRVWYESGFGEVDQALLLEISQEWTEQRLQQLLIIDSCDAMIAKLRELKIPRACVTSDGQSDNILTDYRYFFDVAIDHLKQAGCKKLGIITTIRKLGEPPLYPQIRSSSHITQQFHDSLQTALERSKLTIAPEMMIFADATFSPYAPATLAGNAILSPTRSTFIQYGYEAFMRLWKASDRPDGLIVYPDQAAQGVIMAMLEQQVAVPAELQVVFHKNEGIELYTPFPTLFIETQISRVAEVMLRMARGDIQNAVSVPPQAFYYAGSTAKVEKPFTLNDATRIQKPLLLNYE